MVLVFLLVAVDVSSPQPWCESFPLSSLSCTQWCVCVCLFCIEFYCKHYKLLRHITSSLSHTNPQCLSAHCLPLFCVRFCVDARARMPVNTCVCTRVCVCV